MHGKTGGPSVARQQQRRGKVTQEKPGAEEHCNHGANYSSMVAVVKSERTYADSGNVAE